MKLLMLLTLGVTLSACSTSYTSQAEDRPAHHGDSGFQNPYMDDHDKDALAFIRMRLFGDHEWVDQTEQLDQMPLAELDPELLGAPGQHPRVSWVGHATMLVQYQGVNILTDPMFSDRASPVPFAGPERHFPPAVDIEDLPPIDIVVISHNHYDHLDAASIEALGDEPKYFVPLGVGDWMLNRGIADARIVELDWWDSYTTAAGVEVTATPSQHWSARSLFDRMQTLWATWHVQVDDFSTWFAGDIGYNEYQYREIGERFGPVDLAMIPIGAYKPRDFMKDQHVNPADAVLVHQDVQARYSVGMHWGTFPLSAEGLLEPRDDLHEALAEAGLDRFEFFTLPIGGSRILELP